MPMKNPPHPGRSIRTACLEPLGLSVTDGAEVLGVTRQALNNVIHGKSGISPEMAIRLSKAFGSTPETWLRHAGGLRSGTKLVRTRVESASVPPVAPRVTSACRSQSICPKSLFDTWERMRLSYH